MSKQWKPGKKSVELNPSLRPSRIRRDPVRPDKLASLAKAQWRSPEWEIRLGIAGIVLFALALNAVWFGINVVTSR